jgi:YD repeat-containing protein
VNRRGGVWQFARDQANRLISTTSPQGRVIAQTWNNRGLLGSVTEPSGERVTLDYDGRGRVTRQTGLGGGADYAIASAYDANGNLLTATEGDRVLTRTYDALNRVATYRNGDNEQIGYSYDANGNLTLLTYPDGKTVTYTYDDRDRLVGIRDWANRTTTLAWDANSRLTLLTRPNGTRRAIFYDAAGQVTRIEERRPDTRLIHLQSFAYDAAGRVVNRFTAPVPAPYTEPALNAGYDLDDRMTSYNGQALTHDADGNLLGAPLPDGPWGGNGTSSNASGAFTWDSRNRLTSVTRGDTAQVISYAYDSEGFLVALSEGGQTTRLTVDPHGGRRSQVLVKTEP